MSESAQPIDYPARLRRALRVVRELQAELKSGRRARAEPIAIIGVGCRLPGGIEGPEAYWKALREGVDAISEVPPDRWPIDAYFDPNPETPGKMYARFGGFLDQVDRADMRFFGLSPRQAASTDPQQRMFLEVCWAALEHAGIPPDRLSGQLGGVFVGVNGNDYALLRAGDPAGLDAYSGSGNTNSAVAGSVSYVLGLHGPSLSVDTACSSSLVSVHLACQSLRLGECDIALAGGVNLIMSPNGTIALSRTRVLSPDGRCKAFDASADGMGRGEGCGAVVLKRLSDAITDGDRILATIRGSAVNQDGTSSGVTVPNGMAQQALLRRALANANIEAPQMGYLEAHGTGTSLGDPIEMRAVATVLCEGRSQEQKLIVGSVKTNFGHLEAAAGIAGLIKVALSLHHQEIPAHLHLKKPNPLIPWETLPVTIPTQRISWPVADGQRRIAGVSSFGMSGTNSHVILEEAPPQEPVAPSAQVERPCHLLGLSAKGDEALKALAVRYERLLAEQPELSLPDLCHGANTGRTHFSHRLAVVAESQAQLREQLAAFIGGQKGQGLVARSVPSGREPELVFLFTGQGSQYAGMGRQLYETQPVFRQTLDQCDALLQPHLGRSLLSVLYPEPGSRTPLDETAFTQPALFAIEYALAMLWQSWGIQPTAVMGHSVGEYVAACVAGVFSLEDGLRLIAERGRLMQALPPDGDMAAVFAEEARVVEAIAPFSSQLSIAAVNGPTETVISGEKGALAAVLERLSAQGIQARRLNVSHAFHSPLMQPIVDTFAGVVASVTFHPPQFELISNVTGRPADPQLLSSSEYWCRHLLAPVRFWDSLQSLHQRGSRLFLEIGPGATLASMGRRGFSQDGSCLWLSSLQKDRGDWTHLLRALGELYASGLKVDWQAFDQGYTRHHVTLPTYPFQRERHWFKLSRSSAIQPVAAVGARDLGPSPESGEAELPGDWLYELEWKPWVASVPVPERANSPRQWLIFADRHGLGAALAERIEQRGERCVLVSPAQAGSGGEGTSGSATSRRMSVDPQNSADYRRVIQEAFAEGSEPAAVVHLWGLDAESVEGKDSAALEEGQHLGQNSVLILLQALSAVGRGTPRLWAVTRGAALVGSGKPSLVQAPIWGLGRVLAIEHPSLWGGLVDLDPAAGATAGDVTALLGEFEAPEGEDQVAWRGGQRLVPRLRPQRLPEQQGRAPRLKAEATYLVSGALSGSLLEVSRWMVERGARHLVLAGLEQSEVGALSEALSALESRGAHLQFLSRDEMLQSPEALTGLFSSLRESNRPLRGVLHAGGAWTPRASRDLGPGELQSALRSEVVLPWALHEQVAGEELEFFILFSSVASVWGSGGLSHHAAAHHVLDALAHQRRALGLPALVVNFGQWAQVGVLPEEAYRMSARSGVDALPPATALAVLEPLLEAGGTQRTIASVRWNVFKPILEMGRARPMLADIDARDPQRGDVVDDAVERARKLKEALGEALPNERHEVLQAYLQGDVASVLGYENPGDIEPTAGFFDLGMDSIMAMDLKTRLERGMERTFPSTMAFEHPTIDALARYLSKEVFATLFEEAPRATTPEPVSNDDDARWDALDELSEDQVASLLAERLNAIE
uniref:StiH protein n=1 Tax=Stigmatella aurantiaca TaxID=41 RepID=Q8RJX9_STIAU|nr:StiH protein [Stigmatella aurantiaca Sg a15]